MAIGRTTILGYCTNLNFTYLIQLLTMSLRCFLCFLHELFAIYNEKCPFALSKKIETGRLHQFHVFWGRWSTWNQRIL